MTTTLPPGTTRRGFGIDSRLGAAALRAPAASKEDYRSQAILKLHRPSSLDYRARHGLPVNERANQGQLPDNGISFQLLQLATLQPVDLQ